MGRPSQAHRPEKRARFTKSFAEWDVGAVASVSEEVVERLLIGAAIARSRARIVAVIGSPRRIREHPEIHRSFTARLNAHLVFRRSERIKLTYDMFRLTDFEIANLFLNSLGHRRSHRRLPDPCRNGEVRSGLSEARTVYERRSSMRALPVEPLRTGKLSAMRGVLRRFNEFVPAPT